MVTAPVIDEAAILAVLAQVPDPEIPAVSVLDLGMIRGVSADPPAVLVTPTYTACPATRVIEQSIRAALDAAGYGEFAVEIVLSPPWSTRSITAEGRARLEAYGISPPTEHARDPVACPRCGSPETEEISRFGSTPCKAQWRCRACAEPFDRFKCH